MAKPAARILFLETCLGVAAVVLLGRAVVVQVVQHDAWHQRAESRAVIRTIPARRGTIFDRNGRVLATSEEQYRVGIAPREVRDTARLLALLPRVLGLSPARVAKELERGWAYFNGPFRAEQIAPIRDMRGIHLTTVYRRVYPLDSIARPILGGLDDSGMHGIGGMEQALDSVLSGTPGEERLLRDAQGNVLEIPGDVIVPPRAGDDVYLTLDADMQSIAEGELEQTLQRLGAQGGDVVISKIATGELLAVASFRHDARGVLRRSAAAVVETYEPGSTAKLFTAAAILRSGADTTPVDGEGGRWRQVITARYHREIDDVHRITGLVTLGDAIKYSSNIAMSKFSLRLPLEEQYKTIRDFGFGTPSGLGFPGEDEGLLRRPENADIPDIARPSMAMGYYWRTSTMQMAMGYGAIANHGFLMEPALVHQIRSRGGAVLVRQHPDTVRQAVPDSVAAHLMEYLRRATDSGGTGAAAQLDRIPVYGKTGTAVLNSSAVGAAREHRASFAGIYPGDRPELAIYVMLDRPSGSEYYGGTVAAPVVQVILKSTLASLSPALDRSRLTTAVRGAVARDTVRGPEPVHAVAFPLPTTKPAASGLAMVPDVAGVPLRDAILALHREGFEVRLEGRGTVRATLPAAGDSLPRGTTVVLRADSLP